MEESKDSKNTKHSKRLPGFYIALCCCVIAIGAAGFISQNMESRHEESTSLVTNVTEAPIEENTDVFDSTEVFEETLPVVSEPEQQASAENEYHQASAVEVEEYAIDNPDVAAASITVNAAENEGFLDPVPVNGIYTGYSKGTPEYNEFYRDWRTHNGIDYAADTGCSVSAVSDGTVTAAGEGSYGKFVQIDHGNGFEAVYAQLGEISVNEGDSVSAGSVIGTIADSIGETEKQPHLHFELTKDGKFVDPEEY